MQPRYVLEDEHYAFYWGGECLFETEVVALLVDLASPGLLKHGQPGEVAAQYHHLRRELLQKGLEDRANNLVMLLEKPDVTELNNMLATADYVVAYLARKLASSDKTEPVSQILAQVIPQED